MSTGLPAAVIDSADFAGAGFLARYREPTASAYRRDLRRFWQWCADHQKLPPLAVLRPHLGLSLRDLEARGNAPATLSRRLLTFAGMFPYVVIDELLRRRTRPQRSPGPGCRGKGAARRWAAERPRSR